MLGYSTALHIGCLVHARQKLHLYAACLYNLHHFVSIPPRSVLITDAPDGVRWQPFLYSKSENFLPPTLSVPHLWAEIVSSMEQGSNVGEIRQLYQIFRQVSSNASSMADPVHDGNANFIAGNSTKVERWRDHF
ncbi:unnamed protein product [Schistocephalus solidus]|uniref:Rit1_C domain-containing protein n=1 Tax=Schistocephalus solidus TaxID=70667 RepID=A0A183SG09_SCHSO|nr:unnamed protein product [Schistocephalus solidus]